MLGIEPALPMLKTESTLLMLAMLPRLPMLIMLNKPFTLDDLTHLPAPALDGGTRSRRERVAPYVPLRASYLFARHISRPSVLLPLVVLNAATCGIGQRTWSLHLNWACHQPAQTRVDSSP